MIFVAALALAESCAQSLAFVDHEASLTDDYFRPVVGPQVMLLGTLSCFVYFVADLQVTQSQILFYFSCLVSST